MLSRLKQFLAERYLATCLQAAKAELTRRQSELDIRFAALDRAEKTADIIALCRAQLAGFDPKRLASGEDDILTVIRDRDGEDAELEFLNKVKTLSVNPAFDEITEYLICNQILYGQLEAETLDKLNFSRASINGIKLFKDEVDRLVGVLADRTRTPEEFDAQEVL